MPNTTKRHYPFVTRIAATLHEDGMLPNVAGIDIEPEYGYVTRLRYRDGTSRITRGNDVGLNPAAAQEVVKDKAYTKFFLALNGVSCPRGAAFLLRWWADRLRPGLGARGMPRIRDVREAPGYVTSVLGLPAYVKPVDGSKGADVWRVSDLAELDAVLARYEQERIRVALIEEPVPFPDHRIVVLDGTVVLAYLRQPLSVVGDGRSPVADLLAATQEELRRTGRDTILRGDDRGDDGRISARLRRAGLDWASIPAPGEVVPLLDVANLSLGGTSTDLTGSIAERWRSLAIDVAALFGLRFCGVDLACPALTSEEGPYAVIEVNGSPGLDHYGASGAEQAALVRDLYARVLNTPPARERTHYLG
jgi:D-alanine-D-alanine ligase-like ATP-grasp enzyme